MGKLLSPAVNGEKEFAYHQADFDAVRKKLKKLAGINLADSKDSMVYSRLARRIRSLGLSSFSDYLTLVERQEGEVEYFINALTTNLTSFFRESHHFDTLKNYLKKNTKPVTIWCAASSTGEEPYSIAICCAQARGSFKHNVRILASDIDSNVLATARKGIYKISSVDSLPIDVKRQFFKKGKGSNTDKVKVVSELTQKIEFFQQNLLDNHWQIKNGIDIIFCRNVMIYFDKDTQDSLINRFIKVMNPNGLYIAGHSENFANLPRQLKHMGKTVYQFTGMGTV